MDTSLAANIINLGIGVATFLAVLVALGGIWINRNQAKEDWNHNKQLALEDRQYQSRPIVVPVGVVIHPQLATADPTTQQQANVQISTVGVYWGSKEIQIDLRNIGHGPAFNVSYIFNNNAQAHSTQDRFIAWDRGPIPENDSRSLYGEHKADPGPRNFRVDGLHSIVPEPMGYSMAARLTMTYHDLFGIIHVSIFDYVETPRRGEYEWRYVQIKDGVEHDVQEFYTNADLKKEAGKHP